VQEDWRRRKKRTEEEIRLLRKMIAELQDLEWAPVRIRRELKISKWAYYYYSKRKIQILDTGIRRCNGKPFWIWRDDHHKYACDSCFQHLVGLPEKNGKEMPLFDYEKMIVDALVKSGDSRKDRHLWIKKSTGLGVTELILRYMAWLCYYDDSYRNTQMCIVTGPNINLAKGLIRRLKEICEPIYDKKRRAKDIALVLNGCRVEAFPSHHLDAMRSLPNPKFIFIDEADFFPPKELRNTRVVAERYIAKSDPYIVMVSTPNLPGGLYESIEKEQEETCLYRRLFLPYTVGLNKIYTEQEIQRAKESPSFEREFNLKYGHGIGDIFPYERVDECVGKYDLALAGGRKVLAVDPGFGSSMFAIVGAELMDDGIAYVKEAHQYKRPSPVAMFNIVAAMARRWKTVVVDGSRPEIADELQRMKVDARKISFKDDLLEMTLVAARIVKERQVRIHPAFSELIYQLKAVKFNDRGNPDKSAGLTFDLGDALMMALHYLGNTNGLRIAKI
jgi:hypothetical protein